MNDKEELEEPKYLKPSYICNATAGSLLIWLCAQFVIAFCMMLPLSVIYEFISEGPPLFMLNSENSANLALQNILDIITIVGSVLFTVNLMRNRLKITLPDVKKNPLSIKRILYYAILGMGLSTIASLVIQAIQVFLQHFGILLSTPDFSLQYDAFNNVLMFISTCIIAPIFEELLFRGLILSALKRFGNLFAIIITSLLFGLAHGNLPQSVPVFFLSLVLCYVTLRTHSLVPAMIIHFINNFIGTIELGFASNVILSNFFLILEYAFALLALYFLYRKRKEIASYIQKHKGQRLLSYFTHICPIVYLLLSLFLIVTSISGVITL